MEGIHPDLKDLIKSVTDLLDQYHAETLSLDDAMALWHNLVAIDGEGNRWIISQNSTPPNFIFIKSNPDGSNPVEENPLRFVPATLPPNPDLPFGGVPSPPSSPIPQPLGSESTQKEEPPTSSYFNPFEAPKVNSYEDIPRIPKSKTTKKDRFSSSPKLLLVPFAFLADVFGALGESLSGSSFFAKYKAMISIIVLGGLLLSYAQFFYVPTKDTYAPSCPKISNSVTGISNQDTRKLLGCLGYPGPSVSGLFISDNTFSSSATLTQETFASATAKTASYLKIEQISTSDTIPREQMADLSYSLRSDAESALRYGYISLPFNPKSEVSTDQISVALLKIWNAKKPNANINFKTETAFDILKSSGLAYNTKKPLIATNEFFVQELGSVYFKINDPTFKAKGTTFSLKNSTKETTPLNISQDKALALINSAVTDDLAALQSVVARPLTATDADAIKSLAGLKANNADLSLSPFVVSEHGTTATVKAFNKGTTSKIGQATVTFVNVGTDFKLLDPPYFK